MSPGASGRRKWAAGWPSWKGGAVKAIGSVRLMHSVCLEARSRIVDPSVLFGRDYRKETFDIPVVLFVCLRTYRTKLQRLMQSLIDVNAERYVRFSRDVFNACSRVWEHGKWIDLVAIEKLEHGVFACDRYAGDDLSMLMPAGAALVAAVGEWLDSERAGEDVWL